MTRILVSVIFESKNKERLFQTGYRPVLLFEGSGEYNSAMIDFINCEAVGSGEPIHALLTMLVFERVRSIIRPGVTFSIYESPSFRVGHGHVLAIGI